MVLFWDQTGIVYVLQGFTWLVAVPVGVRHLIPSEPLEGAAAALVVQADPEGIAGTPEHQAVGEGLLEPSGRLNQTFCVDVS